MNASDWIPITERVPEDGALVLVYGTGRHGGFYADALYEHGRWWLFEPYRDEHCLPCEYPSHWMPLPEPPSPVRDAVDRMVKKQSKKE